MEFVSGTVDNVTQGYHHQTTRKGRTSAFSHHTVSFTVNGRQAHLNTHHTPSINPGDGLSIAAKTFRNGLTVYAFVNTSNGTWGTYYLASFYWLCVVWLAIAIVLLIVLPALFLISSPFTIAAGILAWCGHRARAALNHCKTSSPGDRAGLGGNSDINLAAKPADNE